MGAKYSPRTLKIDLQATFHQNLMRYKGKKGKAWEKVKLYVRSKEKDCYTCPARNLQGKNAHAGHYKPVGLVGSNNYWSWHPKFIHLQCGRCNGAGQGMAVEYREHLVRDYGEEIVADFDSSWRKIRGIKNWDEVIAEYELLAKKL